MSPSCESSNITGSSYTLLMRSGGAALLSLSAISTRDSMCTFLIGLVLSTIALISLLSPSTISSMASSRCSIRKRSRSRWALRRRSTSSLSLNSVYVSSSRAASSLNLDNSFTIGTGIYNHSFDFWVKCLSKMSSISLDQESKNSSQALL